ncbi:DUF1223 domain-containing protein [Aurantivibrio plasticivorans]
MRATLLSLLAGFVLSESVTASQVFHSRSESYAIELFTSEGCSSCPPAERWLGSYRDHPELWQTYFPIAWHVDYWDYLGWKDDFAESRHANRQRRYAKNDQFTGVYTPGVIVNGQEYRGWRRGREVSRSIKQLPQSPLLQMNVAQRHITLSLTAAKNLQIPEVKATVLVLGFDVRSNVTRGENRGKHFSHDFVVLHSQSKPIQNTVDQVSKAQNSVSTFTINHEKFKQRYKTNSLAIIAFVETPSSPTPVAIAGGWLE